MVGLYTALFYAIIPACFLAFCCSAVPTSPYMSVMFFTLVVYYQVGNHYIKILTCVCLSVHDGSGMFVGRD